MSFVELETSPLPPPLGVMERLRRETAEHHQRLETVLDILAQPLEKARFAYVLSRFWGFHRTWEPAIEAALGEPLGPRSRLEHVTRDLIALGVSRAAIDRLPIWTGAPALFNRSQDRALGSLYVLEGSTLGGQVISRALAGEDWLPVGGLSYFDPYGSACGFMWMSLKRRLTDRSSARRDVMTIAGARATFTALHRWLTP